MGAESQPKAKTFGDYLVEYRVPRSYWTRLEGIYFRCVSVRIPARTEHIATLVRYNGTRFVEGAWSDFSLDEAFPYENGWCKRYGYRVLREVPSTSRPSTRAEFAAALQRELKGKPDSFKRHVENYLRALRAFEP
jgi:hypothetical protein